GVFAVRDDGPDPRPAPSLARWLAAAERLDTALAAVLGRSAPAPAAADGHDELHPLPLSGLQRTVVHHARTQPVTVVSGVTGSGKTTTAVAVAVDAAARGERVLVVARSAEAVDDL